MRYVTFFAVLFSLSMTASAQVVHLDSMYVVEDSAQLRLFGYFGSRPGMVLVDNLTLPILKWSDSTIYAAIPDTGQGSAGPVEVLSLTLGSSNISMLSDVSLAGGHSDYERHSIPLSHTEGVNLRVRVAMEALLRSHADPVPLCLGRNRTYHFDASIPSGDQSGRTINTASGTYPASDSLGPLFQAGCSYYSGESFVFGASNARSASGTSRYFDHPGTGPPFIYSPPDVSVTLRLDSNLLPIDTNIITTSGYGAFTGIEGTSGKIRFMPPARLIAIQYPPHQISPKNDSAFDSGAITLRWRLNRSFDSYEIELSASPLYADSSVIAVQDSEYELVTQNQDTSYWRVRGVNAEGRSPWSSSWSFFRNRSLQGVTRDYAATSDIEVREDRLVFPGPSRIRIYDLLGRCVYASTSDLTELSYRLLRLPRGCYFVHADSPTQSARFLLR